MARIRITVAVEADRYSYRTPEVERDIELDTILAADPQVRLAVASVVDKLTTDVLAEYVAKMAAKAQRVEDTADTPMGLEDDVAGEAVKA